jgi:hypothetical protein
MIPLTAAETRRLFNLLHQGHPPGAFHERWSDWRRRRQARARKSHYARRNRKSQYAVVVLTEGRGALRQLGSGPPSRLWRTGQ